MDSFEINKILGALLFTCLCLLSLNIAAEAVFHPAKPAKPGFEVAATESTAGPAAAKEPDEPIEKLLASATVEKGANAAKKCAACHTFGKGEPNRVGPNLYGVVGRPKGTEAKFDYSAALKGKGGNWSVDDLDKFLANPKAFAPGTKMSFAGLPRGSERADVIAYLNSKSDNPAPLPKAADAGAAAKPAEAPAAGAAAKPAEVPAGQKK
ncbi:MAG: cytochrome c family protein [Alphaproteobacteria bacterium]|nr:MAG: cytochrome c family protein [Alphaproteobacteria bacterium]